MKIALITDTHFGARNDNINFNEYFYQFYEGIFFPFLEQNNIKHCIHLGDVFDRRKYISFTTLRAAKEMFFGSISNYVIHTSKIPVVIVK